MLKVLFVLADNLQWDVKTSIKNVCSAVNRQNADTLVLIGSDKILEHLKSVKDCYQKNFSSQLDLNVLILKDLDDMDYIFDRFKYKLNEFPDSEIIINYTCGSSKLTAVTMIIARMYGLKIQEKLQIEDTSRFTTFDVVEKDVSVNSSLYFVKKSFNNYDYEMAKEILEENYSSTDQLASVFSKLIDIYHKWDSFEYDDYQFDDLITFFSNLSILQDNKKAMERLTDNDYELFHSYKIADLISNSKRRIEEKKYNDAIIRLYRTLELISEVELFEKYNIRKSDVHINDLKKMDIEEYALNNIINRLDYKYPKYNMPLTTVFFLLYKLNSDVGIHYMHHKDNYQQLFQKRNISVLVHGNYKYNTKELHEMYNSVLAMAKSYDENMEKYIEQTTFPVFKI